MERRPINKPQAYEIAKALVGLRPQPDDYRTNLEIFDVQPLDIQTEMGIVIEFSYTHKQSIWVPQDWSTNTYRLYIGYHQTIGEFNTSTISLNQYVDDHRINVLQVEMLRNLTTVTDKLREFKIWSID